MNFGSHTEKFAYFGSVNGNRSDYGLQTPGPDVLHDRVWGLGGMGSLIYNRDANNQFRFITSLRRDDYQIPNDQDAPAAEIRDVERERDGLASFSNRRYRLVTESAVCSSGDCPGGSVR